MSEPHKRLFTQPLEPDPPPKGPGRPKRARRRRRLRLFSLVRNALALVGLGFLLVELLRWVIIPYVLIPLGALGG